MRAYQRQIIDYDQARALPEIEEDAAFAERGERTLLYGSDREVYRLEQHECHLGTEGIARKAINAVVEGDSTMARMWQKNLAKALMRWTQTRGDAEEHPRVAEEQSDDDEPT